METNKKLVEEMAHLSELNKKLIDEVEILKNQSHSRLDSSVLIHFNLLNSTTFI